MYFTGFIYSPTLLIFSISKSLNHRSPSPFAWSFLWSQMLKWPNTTSHTSAPETKMSNKSTKNPPVAFSDNSTFLILPLLALLFSLSAVQGSSSYKPWTHTQYKILHHTNTHSPLRTPKISVMIRHWLWIFLEEEQEKLPGAKIIFSSHYTQHMLML